MIECQGTMHFFSSNELDARCTCGEESWQSIADFTILEHMWHLPAREPIA